MHPGEAYVTGWGVFLPNAPVRNEELDRALGPVNQVSARVKRRILMNNGITARHYALDPETGRPTHTSAQLTAEAVRALGRSSGFALEEMDALVCGTSGGDQMIPSHGSMVHAELGGPACEVVTTAGVCCAGMSAFKYGYLSVVAGQSRNVVVTGSELASVSLTAQHFQPELDLQRRDLGREPLLAFENDFLRWMLSDGAGAMLISHGPRPGRPALKIDWLDLFSYANESPVCMSFGLHPEDDGSLTSYRTVADPVQLCQGRFLSLTQDVRVLQERLPVLMKKALERIQRKRGLAAERIDWFLPHYSSNWFRQPLYNALVELGLPIPYERWFTNLATKGNTGSASIYIILEELVSSGKLQSGERILCVVPESARMMFAFLHLTVV
jgi:3-oxoacyl-[acyl-carrier-protein] synthase-3